MACMNFEEVFQDVLTIKGSLLHAKGASSLSLHLTERTCPMLRQPAASKKKKIKQTRVFCVNSSLPQGSK